MSVFMVSSETLTGDFPLARPLDKSKVELRVVLLDLGTGCATSYMSAERPGLAAAFLPCWRP